MTPWSGPDFIVIGAQRAGSSSLFAYLTEHPDVARPFKKELHFFDRPAEYRSGLEWYRAMFPECADTEDGTRQITGEASPIYLTHPRVPRLVQRHFPDLRLIAILRNPIDRAYSHYQMAAREGLEEMSFEEAISAEPQRLAGELERMAADDEYYGGAYRAFSYLARGHYAEALERWLEFFPREQLLVLNAEDLRARRNQTLGQAYKFLGLRPWLSEDSITYNSCRYPPMQPETRARLAEYFVPHNERLYDLLGVDWGWR